MDITTFDTLTRFVTTATATTRRSTLSGLVAGAAAAAAGSSLFHADEAVAGKKNKHKNKKRKKNKGNKQNEQTPPPPSPENVCKEKNWCVDRSQTCGPAGGYGRCLVESTGGNLCAEILFQARDCNECAAPNCTNCRCVLAAGGGDRCNNGATGYDFICARAI